MEARTVRKRLTLATAALLLSVAALGAEVRCSEAGAQRTSLAGLQAEIDLLQTQLDLLDQEVGVIDQENWDSRSLATSVQFFEGGGAQDMVTRTYEIVVPTDGALLISGYGDLVDAGVVLSLNGELLETQIHSVQRGSGTSWWGLQKTLPVQAGTSSLDVLLTNLGDSAHFAQGQILVALVPGELSVTEL